MLSGGGKGALQLPLSNRLFAELFGTFWLVLGGCGSVVLAAAFPGVGGGLLGVTLALGLTLLTMAYSGGYISGCHLRPAVTLGLCVGRRLPARRALPYRAAQVIGAGAAAAVMFVLAGGKAGCEVSAGFSANGYCAHSPGGYAMMSALVTEVVLTCFLLLVILEPRIARRPQASRRFPSESASR